MKPIKGHEIDDISGSLLEDSVAWRLLPYLKPHLTKLFFYIGLVFCSVGVAMFAPKLLGLIVDKALVPKNMPLLYRFVALYVGLELFRLAAFYFQHLGFQTLGQSVMQAIRHDLYARLLRMPVVFFDKHHVGKLVTRVTNDTVNLAELFSSSFVMLLSDILLIIGVMTAMILLHWKIGLIAISVFPLMILAMIVFAEKLRLAFRYSREVLARLNGFFAERVAGMHVIQMMQREDYEVRAYQDLSNEYKKRQFDGVFLYSLFHPTITILSAVTIVLVLWFGPKYISQGEIPLGTFVSFLAYVQVLYQPVRNITDRYNVFLAAMSSAERIFTLMDMQEEEGIRFETSSKEKLSGALRFENVTFSYDTGKGHALNNVSFSIKEGEKVALIGHTGAGKTTVTS